MPKSTDFLLIGGGLASATAAETLRKEGVTEKITLLSAEDYLPYHRPPLSKNFLLKEQKTERILVLKERYYKENNIDVYLGTKALKVHPKEKIVETDNSGNIRFKKLLIATGSRIKRLAVPGSDLPGIHYLRSISDAEHLRTAMEESKRAVVIGASFIGMELASTFTKKGIHTTLITREELLFDRLGSPEISEFFTGYYQSNGVDIVFGETVKEFRGKGHVESVVTNEGKTIPCDLVAIGVGVSPEVDFLKGNGINLDDGIVVNKYMQTNFQDIYAAGDVANYFDPVFGLHRRVEHWDNAVKQGKIAAKNMLGKREFYDEVSYFFSDVFDLSFNFLGCTLGANYRVLRGSPKDKSFSVLYLKDGVLRATFLLGRPTSEGRAAGSLIQHRVNVEKVKGSLSDTRFPLQKIPTQIVLILQGGGAMGAFQCGVVRALEEKSIYPDIVAGVSIGAFNGAIIASNPKDSASRLRSFWEEVSLITPHIPNEEIRRLFSSWYTAIFGSPKFFRPRWQLPVLGPDQFPVNWTSLYDPSPVKDLLKKYVDFDKLKDSSTRLLVSAANIETAELETFDSYIDDIRPDHILASGSLPPGFPWTTIKGKHYWDGGIVSNSPLDQLSELCGIAGKEIYIVNLYPSKKHIPRNLMEVLSRKDEIFYSEKIRNDIRTQEVIENYKKLVEEIMSHLEPKLAEQIKQRPRYINTIGDSAPFSITRIIHEGEEEVAPEDYDFSRKSIDDHIRQGFECAKRVLKDQEKNKIRN